MCSKTDTQRVQGVESVCHTWTVNQICGNIQGMEFVHHLGKYSMKQLANKKGNQICTQYRGQGATSVQNNRHRDFFLELWLKFFNKSIHRVILITFNFFVLLTFDLDQKTNLHKLNNVLAICEAKCYFVIQYISFKLHKQSKNWFLDWSFSLRRAKTITSSPWNVKGNDWEFPDNGVHIQDSADR